MQQLQFFQKNKPINLTCNEFMPALNELIENGQDIYLITGWLSNSGLSLIRSSLEEALNKNKNIRLLVGKPFKNDDYEVAVDLLNRFPKLFSFHIGKKDISFIHAKVYAAFNETKKEVFFISGSSNLTRGGMLENIEWNTAYIISGNDAINLINAIKSLWGNSSPINTDTKIMSKTFLKEEFIMKTKKEKLYEALEKYTKDWDYKSIEKDVLNYQKKLLDYRKEVNINEIDYSTFRKDYLFKENWAIIQSEGWTNLKQNIQQEDPRRIFDAINKMIIESKKDIDPDSIVLLGRIPNVLGESVLTELLHKANPKRFPILNRKSAFGYMLLDGKDYRGYKSTSSTPYKIFINAVDTTLLLWKEYLGEKANIINDINKYRCSDRLCEQMYEDPQYNDLRTIWNTQDKANKQ